MQKVRRQLVEGLSTIALGTLLVVQAHCQQSYLDGFVTAVTAHGFHSGASAVIVTGSTKCFQVSFKHNPLVSASSDEWMWPGPGTDTEGTNPDIFPWYVVYGFAHINRYYPDVDYSKLKRGEKEYAQFLEDLRRSEPEAFANRN